MRTILIIALVTFMGIDNYVNAAGCAENSCVNGACVDIPSASTHICICQPGWSGYLCDYPDPSIPAPALCPTNPCSNGATCYLISGGGLRCACRSGYTGLLCDYSLHSY